MCSIRSKPPASRTDTQWDIYQKTSTASTRSSRPITVLGNHDVWGWTAKENLDDQPGFGKALALDRLADG